MIRRFKKADLESVMHLWLDTNIRAHDFILKRYWLDMYDLVKEMLPQAELYVYTDDASGQIKGFIGLEDHHIAGIFVREDAQSKGIGRQLLDHVKASKPCLSLHVYQKNVRAVRFYQREGFGIHAEDLDGDTGEKEFIMMWER